MPRGSALDGMEASLAPSLPHAQAPNGARANAAGEILENSNDAIRERMAVTVAATANIVLGAARTSRLEANERLGICMPEGAQQGWRDIERLLDDIEGDAADLPIMKRPLAVSTEELSFAAQARITQTRHTCNCNGQ